MTLAIIRKILSSWSVAIIFFASCTFTTTRTKDVVFTGDQSKVAKELDSIVNCEHINLHGREITAGKKTDTELEINIINAKNIPEDDNQLKALGKSIAGAVKRNLKDPKEFNTYKVIFIKQITEGSTTKKTWKGHAFEDKDL